MMSSRTRQRLKLLSKIKVSRRCKIVFIFSLREMEELGALKEVEEAALAEAEAAAAEAANAGLFDFEDSEDEEEEAETKKKPKKGGTENDSENGGLILNPKKLNEIKPITNQLEIAKHENQFTTNGSRESLRYKVSNISASLSQLSQSHVF